MIPRRAKQTRLVLNNRPVAARCCPCQLDGLGLANRFGRDEFRRFLRNIAAAGAPDQVRVYSLTAGGVPLAVTLMICEKKRWLLYQTAYTNDALGHLSPGLILLRHIMHQANDAGAEIFDFGLGDEPYKNKFCEVHITLSWAERPNTLKGWIAGLAAPFIAWLRHRAKHDSFARRLATTMLNLPKRFQTASNPTSG